MSAENTLKSLLRACVAQIDGDPDGGGSGFFVAPGYLLTCSHVVRRPAGSPASGSWRDKAWSGRVVFASPAGGASDGIWPLPDVAIVRLSEQFEHPCVRLAGRASGPGADMWAIGRSVPLGDQPNFASIALTFPGMFAGLMRLVGDTSAPSMSGSPVLDLITGEVCGMLKQTEYAVTEYAVPVSSLRDALPADLRKEVLSGHDLYHDRDRTWVAAQGPLWQKIAGQLEYSLVAPLLSAAEEAELLGLMARLGQRDSWDAPGTLYRLYQEAVGPGLHPEPGELRDLRDLVFVLEDHLYQPHQLHPLVAFAEILAEQQSASGTGLTAALWDWSTAVSARQGSIGELAERRRSLLTAAAARTTPRADAETSSVIIMVEPSHHAPDRYLLTVWRYRNREDVIVVLRDTEPHSLDGVMDAVQQVLPHVLSELDDPSAMVELVLPQHLFDEPVHLWQVFRRKNARLGVRYPVVVRDLERFNDDELRRHASPRWDWLNRLAGTPVTWMDYDERRSADELYRWFETSPEHAAMGMPGPATEEPGASCLDAALAAGVPVAVWRRSRCHDHPGEPCTEEGCEGRQFVTKIDNALAATPLSRLPELVRELRAGDSEDIVLLWDNPRRGPFPRRLLDTHIQGG
jgi:hypothetical protein